ncbi:MAG: esterase-like activity of phytase family protein [Acidobacteriota bacterium]
MPDPLGVPAPHQTIPVRAKAVPLDPTDPGRHRVGELTVRAVLELDCDDPRFGGFSGLALEADRWLAVSDRGTWWAGRLRFDRRGVLAGVDNVTAGALPDIDGRPLTGRYRHDAEEVVSWDAETLLIAFEGNHRLHRFAREQVDGWRPATGQQSIEVPVPEAVRRLPENNGLEAVTRLIDGRLFMAAEAPDADGRRRAWVGDLELTALTELVYTGPDGFQPTGAATLPDGDVVVMERFYEEATGPRVRLVRLPLGGLPDAVEDAPRLVEPVEIARFTKPLQVDNFEAVAVILEPVPRTPPAADPPRLFLLSDDNFSDTQRTLLVHAELP